MTYNRIITQHPSENQNIFLILPNTQDYARGLPAKEERKKIKKKKNLTPKSSERHGLRLGLPRRGRGLQ